ncbi:MAG: GyrI-like domain-containing protein [Bacteroidia bacterium]|nr:GyrI-like domain-containing protein [Bacteroidia bacterium]
MKTIKSVAYVLLVIIILLIVISLFLPSKIRVERSKVIKSIPVVVYEQVNILKNWERWSPWHRIDPEMELKYEGPEAGAGASYKWSSENSRVGNGMLKITASYPPDSVNLQMKFMKSRPSFCQFRFAKDTGGTKATWIMISDLGFNPIARYFGLFMDKLLGKDFEKGLKSLDSLCRELPPTRKVNVEVINFPGQHYFGIRTTCKAADIGSVSMQNFAELQKFLIDASILKSKPPISIYFSYSPGKVDMLNAYPVFDKINTSGKIEQGDIKAGKAALAVHFGPYDRIAATYEQVEEWIKTHPVKVTGPPWEEYVTNNLTEKDSLKWVTNIYYPVEIK